MFHKCRHNFLVENVCLKHGAGKAKPPHLALGRLLSVFSADVKGYGFPADFSER